MNEEIMTEELSSEEENAPENEVVAAPDEDGGEADISREKERE